MRKIVFIVLIMTVACSLPASFINNKQSQLITVPQEWFGSFEGKEMTLDDVHKLAEKGGSLMFEDLRSYKGINFSSNMFSYIMVYGVEGGYRLIVNSAGATGKPSRADLESIWESAGSGIDIRYNDVDDFLLAHPSHPALTTDDMKTIAQGYLSREVKVIDLEWWEYADEFPHHSKDPAKQVLRESLNVIKEPFELFMDEGNTLIAISRKSGAIYLCHTAENENPIWNIYKNEEVL